MRAGENYIKPNESISALMKSFAIDLAPCMHLMAGCMRNCCAAGCTAHLKCVCDGISLPFTWLLSTGRCALDAFFAPNYTHLHWDRCNVNSFPRRLIPSSGINISFLHIYADGGSMVNGDIDMKVNSRFIRLTFSEGSINFRRLLPAPLPFHSLAQRRPSKKGNFRR